MTPPRLTILTTLTFILATARVECADPGESTDALAAAEIDKGKTVGLVIGVAKEGDILHLKGYGLANIELSVPATADHVFRIGSITKMFTSAAILLLVEDDVLSLDDPLKKFLPDYPAHGDEVTVRHLLQHTSGIVSFTDLPGHKSGMRRDQKQEEVVARFADRPLLFPPGTRFKYCNSGYFLLGMVIEKASGMTYEEFLTARILDPLGLKTTVYDRHSRIIPNRADGYALWGRPANAPFLSMTQPFAAGALASTAGDLLTWSHALASGKLLKPESRSAMVTPGTLKNGRTIPYGMGCFVGNSAGMAVIRHGGGIPGFITELSYFPQSGHTVVVLANSNGFNSKAFADKIIRMWTGNGTD